MQMIKTVNVKCLRINDIFLSWLNNTSFNLFIVSLDYVERSPNKCDNVLEQAALLPELPLFNINTF